MSAIVLQHPRAAAKLDTQGRELPACWQPLVGMNESKLEAIDALEVLRARWGAALVRTWLENLEDLAQRRGEPS